MIKTRAATIADVANVLSDCSNITEYELQEAEVSSWALLGALKAAGMQCAEAAFDKEGPLYVFNHYIKPGYVNSIRVTAFYATQRYFDLGPRGVRVARKHLAAIARNYPSTVFETHTLSKHPDVRRWFKCLGFECMPGLSNPSRFVYTARQKCRVTEAQ